MLTADQIVKSILFRQAPKVTVTAADVQAFVEQQSEELESTPPKLRPSSLHLEAWGRRFRARASCSIRVDDKDLREALDFLNDRVQTAAPKSVRAYRSWGMRWVRHCHSPAKIVSRVVRPRMWRERSRVWQPWKDVTSSTGQTLKCDADAYFGFAYIEGDYAAGDGPAWESGGLASLGYRDRIIRLARETYDFLLRCLDEARAGR